MYSYTALSILLLTTTLTTAQLFWSPYPPSYYGLEGPADELLDDDSSLEESLPVGQSIYDNYLQRYGGAGRSSVLPSFNPWSYAPSHQYFQDEDESPVYLVRTPRKKNKGGQGGGGGSGHGWGHHSGPQIIHTYEKPVFHLTGPPQIITGKPTYVTDYYYVKKPQPQHKGWGGWGH